MAKPGLYTPLGTTDRTTPARTQTSILLIIAAALYLATHFLPAQRPLSPNPDTNIWNTISPSTTLTFTPCFGAFQCARLLVPLNWNATTDDDHYEHSDATVALAVIKRPARVPITDARYGGPVIVNPGGPGESGVYQVLSDSAALQTVLDSPDEDGEGRLYDIVSFDPRGVNNTTPRLRCFPHAFAQQAWQLSAPDDGLLWDGERVVGLEWARAAALGSSCTRGDSDSDNDGGILRYVNTAQTAEDLRHLVEELGAWRAARDPTYTYTPGREKVQYWGVSYGTLLGATFAALHPERVGRMVLDGVVDPADHYAGAWRTQLQDSDAIVSRLSADCFAAGPRRCAMYTGSSGADVEARLSAILQTLKDAPIPVDTPGGDGPVFITYGDVHLSLLSAMYYPFAMAEDLFSLLPALEQRNASHPELARLAARKQGTLVPATARRDEHVPYVSVMGAMQSIACMDSAGAAATTTTLTRETFRAYLAELTAQGRWISPTWARNKLACVGYGVSPAWRPALSFQTAEWARPAHPLLLVGNAHDTVTPVRNARRVAGLFPGSVVVQQDGEGHCSHAMPSLCTARVIRAYMQTGTTPAEGTVCAPDVRPFVGCTRPANCSFQDENQRLWEALVALADPFKLQINSVPLHIPGMGGL